MIKRSPKECANQCVTPTPKELKRRTYDTLSFTCFHLHKVHETADSRRSEHSVFIFLYNNIKVINMNYCYRVNQKWKDSFYTAHIN
jgi:sugar-specific transcriptional regulator TrmB